MNHCPTQTIISLARTWVCLIFIDHHPDNRFFNHRRHKISAYLMMPQYLPGSQGSGITLPSRLHSLGNQGFQLGGENLVVGNSVFKNFSTKL
jgi:hypothetical protein